MFWSLSMSEALSATCVSVQCRVSSFRLEGVLDGLKAFNLKTHQPADFTYDYSAEG